VSDHLLLAAAAVLLVALAIGMIRVLRGPAAGDRMLAAQLVGTTGVGILLLLAAALGVPALVDVALVLALLAAVAVVAFTRRAGAQADD
jgi:multicomponent Na+:H+ antiporter subunit F